MRASKNIKSYFKYEFILTLLLLFFSILDNNILEIIFALIATIYNVYSKYKKLYKFSMIIDDRKNNIKAANKVSLLYKVKFILYTAVACFAISFFILQCLNVTGIINLFKLRRKY